ncbi:MAG: Imm10 family immunity protein [Planctomycetaceae bacterium]
MALTFHANLVYPDLQCRRLSFLDRDDESSEHYLIFDRSEESPDEAIPDMGNVYLERDDQGWGGYGGIESVTLGRSDLTFRLTPKMAERMGDHEMILVKFDVGIDQWESIRSVAAVIMKGYESHLVVNG